MTGLFKLILSLPKTIYYNFKVFPISTAIKLPILMHYRVKIEKVSRGCIELSYPIKTAMIKFGWSDGSHGVFEGSYPLLGGGYISIDKGSKIIFRGVADLASGISVRVDNGGIIDFGNKFSCNSNCFFAANHFIKFGNNNLLGWRVNIRDVDGHDIFRIDDRDCIKPQNVSRSVEIGNNVWIAACVDILKGGSVPDGCIVAYRTVLTNKFDENNCIIGGCPAKILKHNVKWK